VSLRQIVNLLVNRCEPTVDAADATLLDLAARRTSRSTSRQ
jgi:hypothetical protein